MLVCQMQTLNPNGVNTRFKKTNSRYKKWKFGLKKPDVGLNGGELKETSDLKEHTNLPLSHTHTHFTSALKENNPGFKNEY